MAHTLKKHHQTPPIPKTSPPPGSLTPRSFRAREPSGPGRGQRGLLTPGPAQPPSPGHCTPQRDPYGPGCTLQTPQSHRCQADLGPASQPRTEPEHRPKPGPAPQPRAAPWRRLASALHLTFPPRPVWPRPARRAHGTGASTDTGTSTHSPRPDAPPAPSPARPRHSRQPARRRLPAAAAAILEAGRGR